MRKVAYSALAALMLMVLLVPMVSAQPQIDVLRYRVIRGAARLTAMLGGQVDVLTQISDPTWVGTLAGAGFTITADLGFHVSFIGFNIRAEPLADVNFRHALAHSFDRLSYIYTIYGYIATPVRSLVPPAQSRWYNPAVPEHPFNPGDPFTSPPGEHSAVGILLAAGYTFVDADGSGTVTLPDYWLMPNGDPLPQMEVLSPTAAVDFEINAVVSVWITDLGTIGLQAVAQNGWSGFAQTAVGLWDLATSVYGNADFDAFIVNFKLNSRLPDHLYDWLHSSQDSLLFPFAYNAFGVNDPVLDGLLETVKFSLDRNEIRVAAMQAQEWLADPNNAQGLPVLPAFSMGYFNAFNPSLRGIVRSQGYGSGGGGCVALREPNGPVPSVWTYTNIRWAPSIPNTVVIWTLSDTPERLNPLYAGTVAAWEIMDRVFDPLITVNPYNHRDVPWIAIDWDIELTPTGMDVTYTLTDDVFWQDGYQYTALDAEFSLEFISDWQIPKYRPAWQNILDVVVTSPTTFTVQSDATSLSLIYDWAVLATLLPPQIWDRPWPNQQAILAYNPELFPYGTDMAPGYPPGPTPPPTNLFGTGPFIFQFYDPVAEFSDLWANENYFLTTAQIDALKTVMFHEVGDVDYDGDVDAFDIALISVSFGYFWFEPGYNPDADLDQDGIVDIYDIAVASFYIGWQREYP